MNSIKNVACRRGLRWGFFRSCPLVEPLPRASFSRTFSSRPLTGTFHRASARPIKRPEFLPVRYNSTAESQPLPPSQNSGKSQPDSDLRDVPSYELTFTCKPCLTRSMHKISKQGYHHGTVLITCPNCKNRHVISDHLQIFNDKAMTIEKLLQEKGELVKKGQLSADGDLELWDDGTATERVGKVGNAIPNENKEPGKE